MAWKKPKWVQNVQSSAQNVANAIMPSKPPALQAVQTAAQSAVNKVGDAAKQAGAAVQKAGDKVGDAVRPTAQEFSKEMKYIVNPVVDTIGDGLRAVAKNPVVSRIGDAIAGEVSTYTNPFQDRAPREKIKTENPTSLANTTIPGRALDQVDAQTALGRSMVNANRDSFASQNKRLDNQAGPETPMFQIASGGAGVRTLPPDLPEDNSPSMPSGTGKPVGPNPGTTPQNTGATIPQFGLTGQNKEEEDRQARMAMLKRLKKKLKLR